MAIAALTRKAIRHRTRFLRFVAVQIKRVFALYVANTVSVYSNLQFRYNPLNSKGDGKIL